MKKYIIVLLVLIVLCGCGKKSKKTVTNSSVIGKEDLEYKVSVTCNGKTKESIVTLSKTNEATYKIYECNNNTLELITSAGTYKVLNGDVVITDEYSNKVNIKVIDDNTIDVEIDDITQRLTR